MKLPQCFLFLLLILFSSLMMWSLQRAPAGTSRFRPLVLVYPTGDPELAREYVEKAKRFRGFGRRGNLTLRSDVETQTEDLKGVSALIAGTAGANSLLRRLLPLDQVRFEAHGFAFKGRLYEDPSDVLVLPQNRSDSRVVIITGNSDREILQHLARAFRGTEYRILRKGETIVLGVPENRGSGADSAYRHRDYLQETMQGPVTPHFRFILHNVAMSEKDLQDLAGETEIRHQQVLDLIGSAPSTVLDYHLYSSLEDKAIMTGNSEIAHCNVERGEVHVAREDGQWGDLLGRETLPLFRHALGTPQVKALETGLVTYFAPRWRGQEHVYWAGRLYASGTPLNLKELLDNEAFSAESPLITEPLAAALVTVLLKIWGKKTFLSRYAEWNPDSGEIAAIESAWSAHLAMEAAGNPLDLRPPRRPVAFQKGFNYAHEGYSVFNGYMGSESDRSLQRVAEIGANAVAIIPYSFLRETAQPVVIPLVAGPGSENDGAVVHAVATAHRLGLAVMLKPQIFVSGGWPGNIGMGTSEDWKRFFENYEKWIRHYAVLAELTRADLFCIGTELSRTTGIEHEESWRGLVRRLRKIYSGKITYAANWGEEFEQLSFWDVFDYIGLNSYYPLSPRLNPSDAELLAGARLMVQKAENVSRHFSRPVILTETGFPSIRAPWRQPHSEALEALSSPEDQARSYRAVWNALQGRTWWQGIYWWKWPSTLSYGGVQDRSFSPKGKPAERLLQQWYGRQDDPSQ